MVDLLNYQRDCVDAFRMEFSEEDIKNNREVRELAKYINKQGKKIDKIVKLKDEIFK